MGYIFLEQKLWTPLDFLAEYFTQWRKQVLCIKGLTPLRRDPHNAYQFHVEWALGGSIDWGPDWTEQGEEATENATTCQFPITNRGLIELCSLSAEESKIRIKLSYEPLADEALWQAFTQVFLSPQQQIREDLEEMKEQLENAYIDSLLEAAHVAPAKAQKKLQPRVVPAA